MKLRTDLKAAMLAVGFILALFAVALTEPVVPGPASPTGSLVAPATGIPAIHYGIEPGKGFGKAR